MDVCPVCGLAYSEFRTGLTFLNVRQFLWDWSPEPPWPNVTRRTVLGRWREIKLNWWKEHVERCNNSPS